LRLAPAAAGAFGYVYPGDSMDYDDCLHLADVLTCLASDALFGIDHRYQGGTVYIRGHRWRMAYRLYAHASAHTPHAASRAGSSAHGAGSITSWHIKFPYPGDKAL